jgi:DNA-binding response OmpR family regulator
MRILIIEDFEPIAQAMQTALRDQGHDVDWIIGVRSFEPFLGIDSTKQNTPVDQLSYDLVISDGDLFGPNQGPAIVQQLVSQGVACVGISSQPDFNDKMTGFGAVAGFLKATAFAAIVERTVDMQAWRQPSQQTLDAVKAFDQRLRDDRDLRRKLDSILMAQMEK